MFTNECRQETRALENAGHFFRICVYVSFIGGSVFWGGTCEGFSEPACPAQPFSSQPARMIMIRMEMVMIMWIKLW